MKKILLLALGLFLFFGTTGAVDKKGKVGLGFFNDDAPIGARYWVTERFGIDLGFGLNLRNVVDSTRDTNWQTFPGSPTPLTIDPSKKTLTEFRLDAGLPINLMRTEKVNLLVRPGFTFQRLPFFNQVFRDSFVFQQVISDTSMLPGDTSITFLYDTVVTPFGSFLDTVTEERSRAFDINLNLGIEYFPTENFSVSLFSGVGLRSEQRARYQRGANGAYLPVDSATTRDPRANESDRAKQKSAISVTHRPFLKGVNLGFRYYF
jgi:hypothetical protein